jgi:hypothetical protein
MLLSLGQNSTRIKVQNVNEMLLQMSVFCDYNELFPCVHLSFHFFYKAQTHAYAYILQKQFQLTQNLGHAGSSETELAHKSGTVCTVKDV